MPLCQCYIFKCENYAHKCLFISEVLQHVTFYDMLVVDRRKEADYLGEAVACVTSASSAFVNVGETAMISSKLSVISCFQISCIITTESIQIYK